MPVDGGRTGKQVGLLQCLRIAIRDLPCHDDKIYIAARALTFVTTCGSRRANMTAACLEGKSIVETKPDTEDFLHSAHFCVLWCACARESQFRELGCGLQTNKQLFPC